MYLAIKHTKYARSGLVASKYIKHQTICLYLPAYAALAFFVFYRFTSNHYRIAHHIALFDTKPVGTNGVSQVTY